MIGRAASKALVLAATRELLPRRAQVHSYSIHLNSAFSV